MTTLTIEQKELFAYIDSIIPNDGHLIYDFKDERQYEFAKLLTSLTYDQKEYPGVYRGLELMKEFHQNKEPKPIVESSDGEWQNMFKIPGLNLTKNDGTISSNGLATVVGGYSSMNLSLIVQSKASGNILASGFANNFTDTILTVTTASSTSTEIDVKSYMTYQFTMSEEANDAPHAGVVKRKDNSQTTADPSITHPSNQRTPKLNPQGDPIPFNNIKIGLGRAWTDQGGTSQFDYAWNEPIPPAGQNPKGKIPFVGNVVFSSGISSPLEFNTNFLLNIYVVDKTGGGGAQLSPQDYDKVARAFSIDSENSAQLNWSLVPGTSTSDPGNPIVFGKVPWASDTITHFFCEMDVVLSDNSLASAYVESSGSSDSDPLDGTAYIKPIEFIWHCLTEESLVTMGDGSKKIIKEIVAGDEVQVNGRKTAVVQWTNLGIHKGEILKITTVSGKEVYTSDNHVFITVDGGRIAKELSEGTTLLMSDGTEKIASIKNVEYNGLMCNLATTEGPEENQMHEEVGTFYANDFLVGDVNAQQVSKRHRLSDINWVKKQVPEYLHLDVENYFKAKSRQ